MRTRLLLSIYTISSVLLRSFFHQKCSLFSPSSPSYSLLLLSSIISCSSSSQDCLLSSLHLTTTYFPSLYPLSFSASLLLDPPFLPPLLIASLALCFVPSHLSCSPHPFYFVHPIPSLTYFLSLSLSLSLFTFLHPPFLPHPSSLLTPPSPYPYYRR